MNKLLGNKHLVLGMAAAAAVFVYLRIVVPLLPTNYDNVPVVEFPDPDEELPGTDIDAESQAVQPRLKLATAQYDLRNIDVAMLQFNEHPRRDPFINIPLEAAPLAAVTVPQAPERAPRQTASATPLPVLTAVVHSNHRKAAVIDNQIVHAGDKIGRFRVQSILRDEVVLASVTSNRSVNLRVTP